MGIGNFFRSVWGGLKKGATKIWGGLKKGAGFIGRITKPIGRLAEGAGKIMSLLPGKIGKFGEMIKRGGSMARQITDLLPQGDIRDKLKMALDKGEAMADKYVRRGQEIAQKVSDTGQPIIKTAIPVVDRIGTLATDFSNH